jgi:hypothetical protein
MDNCPSLLALVRSAGMRATGCAIFCARAIRTRRPKASKRRRAARSMRLRRANGSTDHRAQALPPSLNSFAPMARNCWSLSLGCAREPARRRDRRKACAFPTAPVGARGRVRPLTTSAREIHAPCFAVRGPCRVALTRRGVEPWQGVFQAVSRRRTASRFACGAIGENGARSSAGAEMKWAR